MRKRISYVEVEVELSKGRTKKFETCMVGKTLGEAIRYDTFDSFEDSIKKRAGISKDKPLVIKGVKYIKDMGNTMYEVNMKA